ncbi:hypothetical protein AB1Y20_010962 [Prymnesium parvum]|uniref:Uncharacterized protein n=1 Tax=Prymnesium parvum TaxID=97485 RepID=A0AB34IN99_PRYPA
MCDVPCRAALAAAICDALQSRLPSPLHLSFAAAPAAEWLSAEAAEPLLVARAPALFAEFGCARGAPPLQGKSVSSGKSGSAFLVGGGGGVSPADARSYSALLKQLAPHEAALLGRLHAPLLARYAGGSLLAPLLARLRSGGFAAALLDNVARPPPAALPAPPPFDLKGIRLYAHEARLRSLLGARGLRLGARPLAALRRALAADLRLLAEHNLVDYSYLLSVFPSPAPPRPCAALAAHVDFAAPLPAAQGAPLVAALMVQPGGLCLPVLARVGIIDYLREFRFTEHMEHLRNTLVRDVVAGERNHAVVPVNKFARQFGEFFNDSIFSPFDPEWMPRSNERPLDRLYSGCSRLVHELTGAVHLANRSQRHRVRHLRVPSTPNPALRNSIETRNGAKHAER